MPISDLCSKNTVFVKTNDTLLYAAQLMKRHNVGCVVVVESTGKKKLAGILTDRDIAISVATLDKASL
ncbi:MAG: CBS domain-containing protein, partial [Bdellovibrionota bacterium]